MPEDSEEVDIEQQIQQARQVHSQLDQFKQWAQNQAADLRAKAEVADEIEDIDEVNSIPADADSLREAANIISTVYRRIEQGDMNRTRNA